jgi:hypothetical protein
MPEILKSGNSVDGKTERLIKMRIFSQNTEIKKKFFTKS